MRNLDIFVLPSQAEGISNTILEAMASGLPVIATNVGGNAELVNDGVTGSLVEKEDYRAMAASIADYSNDPEKRRLHGHQGHQRVLRKFSIAVMVDKYLEVYNSCQQKAGK
nr:glycosyltransferase [Methylomarinum sp. Ch1-1]MDP4521230.1 glycosyltransferase [Methylomarinum sp. Ch1-1]